MQMVRRNGLGVVQDCGSTLKLGSCDASTSFWVSPGQLQVLSSHERSGDLEMVKTLFVNIQSRKWGWSIGVLELEKDRSRDGEAVATVGEVK